jgi:large subunit ribosomal protein L4
VTLDPAVFGIEPNVAVMHQVVTAQLAAARSGSANTKTRGEVRGGGRKPWRQKGLGRARHGSIRSPQWRGGGTVFGPKPRDYSQRTPKKMRRLALHSALSARAAEGRIVVVDSFDWEAPKTKAAVALLDAMGVVGKTLFVIGPGDGVAEASVRNLPAARVLGIGQLNTYDALWAESIVFTDETIGMVGAGGFEVAADDFVPEDEAEAS